MDLLTNIGSIWNVVVILGILVTAAVYLRRLNQKAYIAAIREMGEGWKAAHDQKATELAELRGRVASMESEYRDGQSKYRTVLELNLSLQQDLRNRDSRIIELEAQVATLERQVAKLMNGHS